MSYIAFFSLQDVALLDKLIKDDRESGKVPLLLIANAGRFAIRPYLFKQLSFFFNAFVDIQFCRRSLKCS